MKDSYIK